MWLRLQSLLLPRVNFHGKEMESVLCMIFLACSTAECKEGQVHGDFYNAMNTREAGKCRQGRGSRGLGGCKLHIRTTRKVAKFRNSYKSYELVRASSDL